MNLLAFEKADFVNMKFSIVTPNYNYGRFLKKALESVLAQVEPPAASGGASSPSEPQTGTDRAPGGQEDIQVEHIVIDGGSTDDSVSILKEWASLAAAQPAAKDGRYAFSYVSEPDDGQTDAINKGLRRATGDIVAWLNADEWYLPGKLALVAAAFAKHPKTDFLYGEPLFVDKNVKPIRVKHAHRFSFFVLAAHLCFIASCCSFWRRRVLDDGLFLDPSYKVIMDGEYYCRLAKAGYRFRFLPETVAAFAWHDDNVSIAFAERRVEERRLLQKRYFHIPRALRRHEDRYYRVLSGLGHRWRQLLIISRVFREGRIYLG